GRIKHHLKHNLWRREAAVLLVGYQAQGTLGRRLQDGAEEVRIHGEPVKVRAEIETISGFSAHADQAGLLKWLRRFRHLGHVFVTHGEAESAQGFAELLERELNVPVVVPRLDESFELKGAQAVSTWDTHYREFAIAEDFSGVCQVVRQAEIKFRGAFGLASRRFKVRNTIYTAFNLGDARQFFAKAALARLAHKGAVDWAALSHLPPQADWEGELAQLTGEEPWQVVEREVFQPLHMNRSGYFFLHQLPAWAASGYTTGQDGRLVENIFALGGSKPQLFSGAPDLTRFWQQLSGGEFLPLEVVRELLAPYWDDKLGVYKIPGQAPGVQVFFGGTLEEPLSLVVLSNGEGGGEHAFGQLAALGKVGLGSGSSAR
ncbi:MAG TPA: MBL fold metallo-hydrolase RNA specificity domain-containing protein, partial [Limnochordia bacterium]|nr:MBL fold metallo-hydrolase RNA specificity domain-containing protein [Limnochordia bacterium]